MGIMGISIMGRGMAIMGMGMGVVVGAGDEELAGTMFLLSMPDYEMLDY